MLGVALLLLAAAVRGQGEWSKWIVAFDARLVGSAQQGMRELQTHMGVKQYGGLHAMREFPHLFSRAHQHVAVCMMRDVASAEVIRQTLPHYVLHAEPVRAVRALAAGAQQSAPLPLDRVDQRQRSALDGRYVYDECGDGVDVFVVDSGVFPGHDEFTTPVETAFTAITDSYGAHDCNGHGTFVASQVAGATYGTAKAARLRSVRVLDCDGAGTTDGVLAGLDWIAAQRTASATRARAAVVNLSLGGAVSPVLSQAVTQLRDTYNCVVVVAAGNDAADACASSPADAARVLTVAASTNLDQSAPFSNTGACVELYAPGAGVAGAYFDRSAPQDTAATRVLSGTSVSAPLVSGGAALLIERRGHTVAQAAVEQALLGAATLGALSGVPPSTPNRLLYTRTADTAPSPQPTPSQPQPSAATRLGALMPVLLFGV